ncbi:MAG: hypothetical protein KatS3mg113_0059 [Planctomycetaceae bacterium]|nr:MAG: hypothetical protein KatS3mg113_0059 [Planctomycetaceae bacterium]
MRPRSWILALSGALSMQLACSQAQEATRTPATPSGTAGSADTVRYTRSSKTLSPTTAKPPVKNFYKELFGEEAVEDNKSSRATTTKSVETPSGSSTSPTSTTPDVRRSAATTNVPASASGTDSATSKSNHATPPATGQVVRTRRFVSPQTAENSRESKQNPDINPPTTAADASTQTSGNQASARADKSTSTTHPVARPATHEWWAGPDSSSAASVVTPTQTSATREASEVKQATHEKSSQEADHLYIVPIRGQSEPASRQAPAPAGRSEQTTVLPTIVTEWVARTDIHVGQEGALDLVVKNTGERAVAKVLIEAAFPPIIRLTQAEPKPTVQGEKLQWTIENLGAGAHRTLSVKIIPSRRGDLAISTQVQVVTSTQAQFRIDEPQLKLAVKGPQEVWLGDSAAQLLTVQNPGSGVARHVEVTVKLSEGLEHRDGPVLKFRLGSLAPGESQQIRIPLVAVKGGAQTLEMMAVGAGELTSTAQAKIQVLAPSLQASITGPGLRYKGRQARYTIVIKNDGAVANNNVRVIQRLPSGFQFVSAERGGRYEASQRTIQWWVGRLEPGQETTLACELIADELGQHTHQVQVTSEAGINVQAEVVTRVEGIAAMETELVDLNDPVETGVETAWELRVRNSGSKAAEQLSVVCELPTGVTLLSARGAAVGSQQGQTITFKPLAELAPGQQAIYRIHVKGHTEGVHRLRVQVKSAAVGEPITLEEPTRFYQDARP